MTISLRISDDDAKFNLMAYAALHNISISELVLPVRFRKN